jgi:hypothetical protein
MSFICYILHVRYMLWLIFLLALIIIMIQIMKFLIMQFFSSLLLLCHSPKYSPYCFSNTLRLLFCAWSDCFTLLLKIIFF